MADQLVLPGLASHWGAFALRGAAAVLFGILTFIWPQIALASLVLLWGAYALVDGVMALLAGLRTRIWSLLLVGLVGIGAGVATFFYPGLTALVLLYVIAAWAIITGLLAIYVAIRLRRELTQEWLLALAGALSVAFGVLLIMNPGAGALSVILVIGAYALVCGLLLLMLAFKLRSVGTRLAPA